ncbi:MAG: undecaprenyl-phosphate glucose phosphotransferase [Lachnospiraceae bacterium]|nr:undecaprenyl-phosphate glucose phosphotransferase [Candidatus Merdinaster equi]
MIKDNQRHFNRLLILLDACVTAGSYMLAWFFKFQSGVLDSDLGLPMETYFFAMLFIVPGFAALYSLCNLYSSKRISGRVHEVYNIFKANTLGLGIFMIVLFVIKQQNFSREMVFFFYLFNTVLDSIMRMLIRNALRFVRNKGYNVKYILLVGYSRAAEQYIDRINSNPQWGYVIRGILDDNIPRGTEYKGVKVLGEINNLPIILPQNRLDEIGITLALEQYGRLEEIVGLCEKSGVHTKFIPDYNSVIPSNPYMEDLVGLPVVNIRHVPLSNTVNAIIKRLEDLIGSLFCIILFSPIMLVTAILVKCTSKGPVIFKQERVGRHGKNFMMYKFRSMEMQKEEKEKEAWTTRDDPRVTGVGKFLRKTSIDELPQLFNVFIGQMSLVGPRPERPQFVEKFKEQIPRYMVKHQVRPGMTGWAQVRGFRGDTSIRKRVECDLYYIENWTLLFDIKILVLTLFKGFINKNAY